ncbi:hypothetical protein Swit_0801 [Rhizorhabdus wittichii RW1]|uniref:Uncharacterized protein n=1 Tax=Rhizorhabdus wittichii (strain DSM 6014 / CCUG 31198 / JCM 15750 / NBRC 105917 / EY 4224 / RW1) TaxID=392499 RepID=A0A9J9H919_RHIWR|nr:hypothetical protein Swit_0801 [Rhizorhabdus wittichii RW1]
MRHHRGCHCEQCWPPSTSDLALIGILLLVGLGLILMSGSKLLILSTLAVLAVASALKFLRVRQRTRQPKSADGGEIGRGVKSL